MAWAFNDGGKSAITQVKDINFIDIKTWTSQEVAKTIFGQGLTVNSENDSVQKFLNEFMKKTRFDGLMLQAAEAISYWGGVVLMINKNESGEFNINIATPELMQIVEEIDITPYFAKLMVKRVMGLKVYYITETWTRNEVIRSVDIKDKDGKSVELADGDTIPEELNLPEREWHGLGFVPIIKITNKEARNVMLNGFGGWTKLADDYSVRHLPLTINYGLIQQYKEKWKGASRIFGSVDSSYANKMVEQGTISKMMGDDYVISTDMTQNQSKPVEVAPSTYDGMKWIEATKSEIDIYRLACGLSPLFGNNAQQTEAETLFSKDNTQKTMKEKRRRYTEFIRDLFAKLIVYNGMATDIDSAYNLFSIEIKENVVYNQLQLVEFLNQAIESGLMTRIEAIMLQRDIDNKEDAEAILNEIEADQQARDEQLLSLQQQQMDIQNAGDGMGAMGNGEESDPMPEER